MSSVIYSHQRCGSTNLLRFLAEVNNIDIGNNVEPFNQRLLTVNFPSWKISKIEALQDYFSEMLRKMPVTKFIYGNHLLAIDQLLLQRPEIETVLFLYRENADAAALSFLTAQRFSQIFRKPRFNEPNLSEPISEISPAEIRERSRSICAKRDAARDLCLSLNKQYKIETYESLFEYSVVESERIDKLRNIVDFMGIKEEGSIELAYKTYMMSDKKINSYETYSKIENIDELQREFPHVFEGLPKATPREKPNFD